MTATATSDPTWVSHRAYAAHDPRELAYLHRLKPAEPGAFPCGGTFRLDVMDGPYWLAICDGCERELAVRVDDLDAEWMFRHRLERAHLPLRQAQADDTKPTWQNQARAAINRYVEGRAEPPILIGPVGAGKTFLLAKAGAWLIRARRVQVRYWPLVDLLDTMRRSIDEPELAGVFFGTQRAPVLIIDDLGAERPTDWAAERLQALVDFRYRENLPTLGATNLHPDEWAEAFGPRVARRLKSMCELVPVHGEKPSDE